MGRLVRRTEPHAGERWHNRHPRLGDRPGRAAWFAEQGTRLRSALDRGYAARFQTNERDRKMKITASNLTHWAGLSAIVAGIMYVIVGLSHTFVSHYGGLASVTNDVWVLTHSLTIGVSFFGLLGIAGIYARQVEKAGWFGLAGFLLLSLWLVLVPGFTFFEAFILPLLASDSPKFAESFLGIFTGSAGETSVGALATLWSLLGVVYILGNVLFGIATFRGGILSRWAAGLLGLGAVSSPAFALLPQSFAPLAAVPVGLGLAWLGYSLWSDRREPASQRVPARERVLLSPTPTG